MLRRLWWGVGGKNRNLPFERPQLEHAYAGGLQAISDDAAPDVWSNDEANSCIIDVIGVPSRQNEQEIVAQLSDAGSFFMYLLYAQNSYAASLHDNH